MNARKNDPPAAAESPDPSPTHSPPRPDHPTPPAADDSEMGGEAACQLHRWWDDDAEPNP